MPVLGLITFAVIFYVFTQEIFNPKKADKDADKDFGKAFREIVARAVSEGNKK